LPAVKGQKKRTEERKVMGRTEERRPMRECVADFLS